MLIRQLSGGAGSGSAAIAPAVRIRRADASHAGAAERIHLRASGRMPRPRRASSASIPRNLIAQAALETGWGTFAAPAATVTTCSASRPAVAGTARASRQTRKSLPAGTRAASTRTSAPTDRQRESVEDYVRLIRDNPRYAARAEYRQRRAAPSPMRCSAAATPPIRTTPTSSSRSRPQVRATRCRECRSSQAPRSRYRPRAR